MKNFSEIAIIERIKFLRSQHAGERGKSRFARDLGISASTYNYYESARVPPIDILLKICRITGADLEWLLTGQGRKKGIAPGKNSVLLQELDEFDSN